MPMLDLFPRPIRVMIGERQYKAWELRFADRADLDAYRRDITPWKAEVEPEGLGDRERKLWAARQYLRARNWPPRWSTPIGDKFQRFHADALFLATVLRIPGRDAVDLLGTITPDEWLTLMHIAYGHSPLEEAIEGLSGPTPPTGSPITTEQAIVETMTKGCLSFAQVEEMTLTQLRAFRSGGKPATDRALSADAGKTLRETARDRKLLLREAAERGGF